MTPEQQRQFVVAALTEAGFGDRVHVEIIPEHRRAMADDTIGCSYRDDDSVNRAVHKAFTLLHVAVGKSSACFACWNLGVPQLSQLCMDGDCSNERATQ